MNLSVFQFILSFLTVSSSKSKATKWLLVSKLIHKGVITCEDNSEIANELQCVEASLSSLISEANNGEKLQAAHERLEALENAIESVEIGLENLFRRLIKTRSSLLNITSQ
ncbi:unnamed protein product [Lathyrus sativus]|nr:unnamed protein product [Lathyrus sativus]